LSRARHSTRLYVATMTDERPDHLPDAAGAAVDIIAAIIERGGAEPSASEAIREALAAAGDLRRMAVEYEHALGVHVAGRYRDAAELIHPGISADPAWPSVAQRLHLAEATGLDVEATLRRAETKRDYTDARSDTQVLVFRLDRILASSHRHSGGPPPAVPAWLAAAPPGRTMPTPWDSYLPARYTEMAERISSLVIEATAEPVRWLRQIGEGPGRDEALRQVVAYRAVYAIDGDDPLGPEPAQHTRHHQAWSTATTAIQASNKARPSGAERLGQLLLASDAPTVDDPIEQSRRGPTRTT
jgi:Arc/MetJ-type ribon-helix-helix transcriptional regulator